MKEQEYKNRLAQLEKTYDEDKVKLAREYAEKNNPYEVGDIIKDHSGSGRILSWKLLLEYFGKPPSLIYWCDNLTKKGTINKVEPKRSIYQINIEV